VTLGPDATDAVGRRARPARSSRDRFLEPTGRAASGFSLHRKSECPVHAPDVALTIRHNTRAQGLRQAIPCIHDGGQTRLVGPLMTQDRGQSGASWTGTIRPPTMTHRPGSAAPRTRGDQTARLPSFQDRGLGDPNRPVGCPGDLEMGTNQGKCPWSKFSPQRIRARNDLFIVIGWAICLVNRDLNPSGSLSYIIAIIFNPHIAPLCSVSRHVAPSDTPGILDQPGFS